MQRQRNYVLAGLVHYAPPANRRSKNALGHYTALCPRQEGKWMEFDDMRDKEVDKNQHFLSCPSLLIFREC